MTVGTLVPYGKAVPYEWSTPTTMSVVHTHSVRVVTSHLTPSERVEAPLARAQKAIMLPAHASARRGSSDPIRFAIEAVSLFQLKEPISCHIDSPKPTPNAAVRSTRKMLGKIPWVLMKSCPSRYVDFGKCHANTHRQTDQSNAPQANLSFGKNACLIHVRTS